MSNYFSGSKPCENCPYRKDAPLKLWDKSEFEELLNQDKELFGSLYLCHKSNGCACIGWLINQRERNYPNITLRIRMIKSGEPKQYFEGLSSPHEMYESVEEMIAANFPSLLKEIR